MIQVRADGGLDDRSGFPNLSTNDIWCWIVYYCGDYPVHCRVSPLENHGPRGDGAGRKQQTQPQCALTVGFTGEPANELTIESEKREELRKMCILT